MVLLKLALWDGTAYFGLHDQPQHDLKEGLNFFASSMHSVRLTGDLAWWNPVSGVGYPQYYQMFLAPLVPTPSHITWIIWSQGVFVLSKLGFKIAEYRQYLFITSCGLPFLAYSAFSYFAFQFIKNAAVVFWLLLCFSLSGIGLWNNAWFFFQEPASGLFLLGSFLAFLKYPSVSRFAIFLAAFVIQVCSANYWTIYSSWFLLTVGATFAYLNPGKVRSALRWYSRLPSASCLAIKWQSAFAALVCVIGLVFLVEVWHEQAQTFERTESVCTTDSSGTHYTKDQVAIRVKELRTFLLDSFNPGFEQILVDHPQENPMHNARYLGLTVLPLVLIALLLPGSMVINWLLGCTLILLAISLASPPIIELWNLTPGMNRILHQLYFYSHFFQEALVLLGAAAFDRLLIRNCKDRNEALSRLQPLVLGTLVLSFCFWSTVSPLFQTNDRHLQGALYSLIVLLASYLLIVKITIEKQTATRHLFLGIFLLLSLGDFSDYYLKVCKSESSYAHGYLNSFFQMALKEPSFKGASILTDPRDSKLPNILKMSWKSTDNGKTFASNIFSNLPICNQMWPVNHFLVPIAFTTFQRSPDSIKKAFWSLPDVCFTPSKSEVEVGGREPTSVNFVEGGYNRFAFDVSVPTDGWLLIRQLPDSAWVINTDKERSHWSPSALRLRIVLPITKGIHRISMDYLPLSRVLYPWFCGLQELFLLSCILMAIRMSSGKNMSRE